MKTTFADLGLSPTVLDAIKAKGFEEPTEIQAKTPKPQNPKTPN